MQGLDKDQIKKLQALKKDLAEKERISKSIPAKITDKQERTSFDEIFDRVAISKEEGIHYLDQNRWLKAPFGESDRQIFTLIAQKIDALNLLSIGFPRVPVGIATWISTAIMTARILAVGKLLSSSFAPALKKSMPWILIACRERALRDVYLSQRIVFNTRSFEVSQFPLYRINRAGRLAPISLSSPNELSTPVVFYHFEDPDFCKHELNKIDIGLILCEISESDGRSAKRLYNRLEQVRSLLKNPKTCVFFNTFNHSLRKDLSNNGYKIFDMHPSTEKCTEAKFLHTISSTFRNFSFSQSLVIHEVEDNDVSQSLYEAAKNLAAVTENTKDAECREILASWWRLWRSMKDLSIPIDIYERYRINAQGRGSLEYAISRVSKSTMRMFSMEGKRLQAVAPVIESGLQKIFDNIVRHNPKADYLMSAIRTPYYDLSNTLFALYERTQVLALREHLLFDNYENLDDLIMTNLARAVPQSRIRNINVCVLPGVWASWQDATILAIGSPKIDLLLYPYEYQLLRCRIDDHISVCGSLKCDLKQDLQYPPIFVLPSNFSEILKAQKKDPGLLGKAVPPVKWQNIEKEVITDTPSLISHTPIIDSPDENGLIIIFDDGTSETFRPHAEVMLATDDGVETVFADSLHINDTIVVFTGDVTRSIFNSVLARVSHLIRVDHRIIELWKSTIRKILFTHRPFAIPTIIGLLRKAGCDRADMTIRLWFMGTTMAPQDTRDIRHILDLAGISRSLEMSKSIGREVEIIRTFNRRLGRRIRAQLKMAVLTGPEARGPKDRLDFEIDEAIEAIEYRTIESITPITRG